MRCSGLVLAVALSGCVLRDYANGVDAWEKGRYAEAAALLEKSLADPAMDPARKVRAAGMRAESLMALGRLDDAFRAADKGADLLLADYRVLDMSDRERDELRPILLMRYSWRVGLGALKGLASTRTPELREEKVRLAEPHLRAANMRAPIAVWRGEILADLLEALQAVDRASPPDLEALRRIAESPEAPEALEARYRALSGGP